MTLDETTQPSMYCRKCGYRLRGLSENRCPECGIVFDPRDPYTFRTSPPGFLSGFGWAGTPGRLHTALTIICALYLIDAASYPLGLESVSLIPFYPVALVMIAHYAVGLASKISRRTNAQLPRWQAPWPRRWAVLPICLGLTAGSMVFSNQLLRWRFAVSRSAFETVARNTIAGRPPSTPRIIGLYLVQQVRFDGTAVEFVTGETVVDPCGFEFNGSSTGPIRNAQGQVAPGWSSREW